MCCWAKTGWLAPFAYRPAALSIPGGLDDRQIFDRWHDGSLCDAAVARAGDAGRDDGPWFTDQHRVHVGTYLTGHRTGYRRAIFGGGGHRHHPDAVGWQSHRPAEQSADQPRRPRTDATRRRVRDVRPAREWPA